MSLETERAVSSGAKNFAALAPPLAPGWSVGSLIAFTALMATAFALPDILASLSRDDDLTRNTVRVSLVFYALAEGLALAHGSVRLVRLWWTLGWLGYLMHLLVAFPIYHHRSHAEAVEHVREAAGVGRGIYVSHFFTVLWTLTWRAWLGAEVARAVARLEPGPPPWLHGLHRLRHGRLRIRAIRWAGVLMCSRCSRPCG